MMVPPTTVPSRTRGRSHGAQAPPAVLTQRAGSRPPQTGNRLAVTVTVSTVSTPSSKTESQALRARPRSPIKGGAVTKPAAPLVFSLVPSCLASLTPSVALLPWLLWRRRTQEPAQDAHRQRCGRQVVEAGSVGRRLPGTRTKPDEEAGVDRRFPVVGSRVAIWMVAEFIIPWPSYEAYTKQLG